MRSSYSGPAVAALTVISAFLAPVTAQTYSTCNPLIQSGCPANPALGRSVSIDFASGSSNEFTSSGSVSYDSNGAAFTVARSGDSPSISSAWYIMFGRADFVIRAAPGTGIVSAAVLQSDCLDEIDWEWLGGDNDQAQSNYFGKGIVTTYNRGAFHGAPNNHDEFHTYSIDWTADQIVWSVDGTTVRVLSAADADPGQFPQTPMYVKLGAWAGGDPGNPSGTIAWAGGVTDYSAGPFTMYVKSVAVTDYSTGNSYSYSGSSGTWDSIVADGGSVNPQGNGGTPVSTGDAPAVTSTVPNSAPLAFDNGDNDASVYATRTGWPWSGTATATAVTATQEPASPQPLLSSPVSSLASASVSTIEVVTSWDDRGFPTVLTIDPNAPTTPVSYDEQGFTITPTSSPPAAPVSASQSTDTPSIVTGSESGIPPIVSSSGAAESAPVSGTGSAASASISTGNEATGTAAVSSGSEPTNTVAPAASSATLSSVTAGSSTASATSEVAGDSTSSGSSGVVSGSGTVAATTATSADTVESQQSSSTGSGSSASGSSSSLTAATSNDVSSRSTSLVTSTRSTEAPTSTGSGSNAPSETPPAPNAAPRQLGLGPLGIFLALGPILFI